MNEKVEIIYKSPRKGDVKRNCSDISKARNLLRYEPKYSLEEGLKVTFKYFLKKYR